MHGIRHKLIVTFLILNLGEAFGPGMGLKGFPAWSKREE